MSIVNVAKTAQDAEKSLISNTDFSNLENDFLEICLFETVISNLILKNPWGLPRPPFPGCVYGSVCVWYVWGVGVELRGGHVKGSLKTGFRD